MKRKIKILVLDGGHRWGSFSQKVLSKHGYEVEVDFDPEKALEKLSTKRYDVIILDCSASQGNGLSILKRIHSEHPEERVIVVSASPSWREGKEAYFEGALDYVSKSFDEVALTNVVREDLTKKTTDGFTRK